MNAFDDLKTKLTNSISFKLMVILFLILMMQIPLSSVKSLIYERQEMEHMAQNEISKRWGNKQKIGTPMLIINRKSNHQDKLMHTQFTTQSHASNFDIQLQASKRYLGIFEAAIYVTKIKLTGTININLDQYEQKNSSLSYQLFIPLKQLRGLKNIDNGIINGKELSQEPYQFVMNEQAGLAFDLQNLKSVRTINYEFLLSIAGSQQFDLVPLARKTSVVMQSNWRSPSFTGDYLPDERSINEQGFNATWTINQLNLSTSSSHMIVTNQDPTFGVKILIPANIYQVNERTVKYSFLVIVLTFAGFFLTELFFKVRLHPFQYLLIGLSLSTFYLLLLSISEYLSFNMSFLISSFAIICLISSYCSVILHQKRRGLYSGALFAVLYGFIFVLVKAEQTSLLMGSLGILFILSIIMFLTRKIDWYSIERNAL